MGAAVKNAIKPIVEQGYFFMSSQLISFKITSQSSVWICARCKLTARDQIRWARRGSDLK